MDYCNIIILLFKIIEKTALFVDSILIGTACCGVAIGYFVVMLLALIYVL